MKTTDKIILTDCDGVLLDWAHSFDVWMKEHLGYKLLDENKTTYKIADWYKNCNQKDAYNLIREFNNSFIVGCIPAYSNSVYYVNKLYKEHGYKFRVITSMSLDKKAERLRDLNLRYIFKDAIDTIVCLDTGADKTNELSKYKDSGLWWIEDKIENADLGHKLGLRSILLTHSHNVGHVADYKILSCWEEIYKEITRG